MIIKYIRTTTTTRLYRSSVSLFLFLSCEVKLVGTVRKRNVLSQLFLLDPGNSRKKKKKENPLPSSSLPLCCPLFFVNYPEERKKRKETRSFFSKIKR